MRPYRIVKDLIEMINKFHRAMFQREIITKLLPGNCY